MRARERERRGGWVNERRLDKRFVILVGGMACVYMYMRVCVCLCVCVYICMYTHTTIIE